VSNVTISDVARKVGVSESTVSRCLSGFNVRNAEAIRKAIKELGYRPNLVARNLKSGRTGLVALIVPDITNPFFASIVRGAELAAGEDYMIQLINTGEQPEREEWAIQRMMGQVDGIIYVPSQEDSEAMTDVTDRSIPLVFVDRLIKNFRNIDSVLADNLTGGEMATQHLLEHGHTKIAHISGPLTSTPGKERAAGFARALKAHKIKEDSNYFVESDFTVLGGYQAMMSLLSLPTPPTAVFVANNQMTIGALKALKEKAIKTPEKMAIIGFDDHELTDLIDPPLTVISRDAHLQGAIAMQTLLERIKGGNQFPPKRIKVDVRLIVRGSCGSTCRHRETSTSNANKVLSASTRS